MSPRSNASARAAGSRFERSIADCLAHHVDDRIDRRVKTGAKDRGDIGGLRHMGGRVVVETKDYGGRYLVGPWLTEAEVERGNDDAVAGLVVAKRRGVADPLDQVVFMTVRDLVALLVGERPDDQTAPSPSPVGDGAPGPAVASTPAAGPDLTEEGDRP